MLKTIVATLQTVVMGSSLSQQSAVETISHWRSQPPHVLIFDSGRREISRYMEAVDKLHQSNNSGELIPVAMARLKREFIAVLSRQADYHHHAAAGPVSTITTAEWSSVTDSTAYAFRYEDYVVSDPPSTDVVTYLKNIAQRMNAAGKLGECIRAYKSVRRSFIQAQLSRLRFEELSVNLNAKRYLWDELKVKMQFWVQLSKICVKKLFDRERRLCDEIFQGIIGTSNVSAAKDECFVGTVQDFAVGLFGFAESMSLSSQPYERMETVFSVYDAFMSILPNVKALFDSVPGREIINRCEETLSNIEIEVTRMLYDFENAILHEKTVSNLPGEKGSVHQRTEYVMDKINLIVKNKNLLTNLIKSTPSLTFGDSIIPREALGDDSSSRSFLNLHLILIIVVLEQNLQNRADSYPNPTLGHLFTMNNLRYVLAKIRESSELKQMIGDSFMKLLNEDFESAMNSYKASTCDKFLNCFKDDGLYITCCFFQRPMRSAVRERLKAFNVVFEEIKVLHCKWTVPDSRLRDEVRVSMSEKLVPEYKNFLEKFGSDPRMKLILDKNVKYSAEDLEELVVQKLFADTQVKNFRIGGAETLILMEQNLWPAIRSKAMVYLYQQLFPSKDNDKLEALRSQLIAKEEAKTRLLREEGDNKAEVEILENEMRTIKEAIDRQQRVCDLQNKEAEAEVERMIESFSTPRWVRITRWEDLTAIKIMKKKFPRKKIRFCLGRKAHSVECIQQMAGSMGIGVMAPDKLHEVSDHKFKVVSETECRILQFTF